MIFKASVLIPIWPFLLLMELIGLRLCHHRSSSGICVRPQGIFPGGHLRVQYTEFPLVAGPLRQNSPEEPFLVSAGRELSIGFRSACCRQLAEWVFPPNYTFLGLNFNTFLFQFWIFRTSVFRKIVTSGRALVIRHSLRTLLYSPIHASRLIARLPFRSAVQWGAIGPGAFLFPWTVIVNKRWSRFMQLACTLWGESTPPSPWVSLQELSCHSQLTTWLRNTRAMSFGAISLFHW